MAPLCRMPACPRSSLLQWRARHAVGHRACLLRGLAGGRGAVTGATVSSHAVQQGCAETLHSRVALLSASSQQASDVRLQPTQGGPSCGVVFPRKGSLARNNSPQPPGDPLLILDTQTGGLRVTCAAPQASRAPPATGLGGPWCIPRLQAAAGEWRPPGVP